MISDDSGAVRLLLKDILIIGQHQIVGEATNGIETVEQYTALKPDVVLLDMAMPKKDGLSALREILAINPHAKVIMITASDNQKTIKECLMSGASGYILKPFNFEQVLKTITEITM